MKGRMKKEYHENYGSCSGRACKRSYRFSLHRLIPVLTTSFMIILCCVVFGGFLSSAHNNLKEEPVNFKYYKSITVEKGDTLWGIAEEYMTDDYDSIEEYIDALKVMNNLNSDKIKAGEKIMIAYNDTTFIH